MRRLSVILTALALFLVSPASAATAQDDRFVVSVYVSEAQIGVTEDGSLIARGTFEVAADGVILEAGVERSVYQVGETTARGTRVYRDAATGSVVVTLIKASLVEADEANGVFVYETSETIISSTEGLRGHGVGTAVVTVQPDGSFTLESWTDVILDF
jgi:hypothetical protein